MNRIELTYPRVGFQRPLIYLGLVVVLLAANLIFGKSQFLDQYAHGKRLTGPSLFEVLTGFSAFMAGVSAIMDLGFVAEISNNWTSLDGLFNLFRRRRDQ